MAARVVVVGAGIAGLAAASELARWADVTVLEAAERVGGKLRTGPLGVDEGAESFLARVPEGVAAATTAGTTLVAPATTAASLWLGGRLRPLPTGTILGVPAGLRALPGLVDVIGVAGAARTGLDWVLPASSWPDDPAVGRYVRARLGNRVVDRLVDPLLGGVYAGRADELSVQMTAPQLAAGLGDRSLLRAAQRLRPAPAATGQPVFLTAAETMGGLAERLASASGASVQTGRLVRRLDRSDGGWRVDGEPTDAIVLATPNAAVRRLLAPLWLAVPPLDYASVALATFVFAAGTPLPPGSGFLVPAGERKLLKAATFLSQKWPHVAERMAGAVVVRVSAGRAGEGWVLQRPDVELAGVLAAELAEATGVRERPVAVSVRRWGGGLPQYRPGHRARVAAFRSALPPGLAVAGAAWDGVGVPACVRSGWQAAAEIRRQLVGETEEQ